MGFVWIHDNQVGEVFVDVGQPALILGWRVAPPEVVRRSSCTRFPSNGLTAVGVDERFQIADGIPDVSAKFDLCNLPLGGEFLECSLANAEALRGLLGVEELGGLHCLPCGFSAHAAPPFPKIRSISLAGIMAAPNPVIARILPIFTWR
jgi:hypothetical protein